ncbi:hypothetical protein Tco_0164559 [Tanacetum coccineum]
MQLIDLMILCTKLQTHVLDFQKAKDAQAKEIDALKKRIQRLERRKMSRPTGLKRLRTVGMSRRVESSEDQRVLGALEDAIRYRKTTREEEKIKIARDDKLARDFQAKLDAELLEEQKLARKQEEEANIALRLTDKSHISRSIPSSLHGSHNPKSSPFPAVNLGCYKLVSEALWYRELGCIREMSQSLSSNVPDNSPEQEAATGHSNLRRLGSPTSQAIQLPELELTLTPATRREHSQEINNLSVPALISQAPGPTRKRIDHHHLAIPPSDAITLLQWSDTQPRRCDCQTRGPESRD